MAVFHLILGAFAVVAVTLTLQGCTESCPQDTKIDASECNPKEGDPQVTEYSCQSGGPCWCLSSGTWQCMATTDCTGDLKEGCANESLLFDSRGNSFQKLYCYNVGDQEWLCQNSEDVCFPGDSFVSLASGDWASIGNLTRWQAMKSPVISSPAGHLSSSEFIVDAHPDPHGSQFFEYIELQHERSSPQGTWPPLKISSGHFLFAKKVRSWRVAELVPAADVMVGDSLLVEEPSSPESLVLSKVTKITRVLAQGIYSPQTASGRLIVNGVAVSSYAVRSGTIDWWRTFPEVLRQNIEGALWFIDLFAIATLHRVMFPVEMLPKLVPHVDISGALIRLGGIFTIF